MHIPSVSSLLLAILILPSITEGARKPADAILLSQVKSLTLRDGAVTSHRRVSAIPQLKCIGGAGCKHYHVDTMRCKNAGSTYGPEDIQWTCTANLPPEFKLGSTDVVCEGYDGPDDPYVLKGSCGVEYRLMLTEAGEEKYGKGGGSGGGRDEEGLGFVSSLFWIAFLAVGGYILWGVYASWREQQRRALGQVGGGGGWGGWGGGGPGGGPPFDDAPPPYPGYPGQKPTVPVQPAQGWQPGFWTGALGGAAAGWLAGNRGNRQEERRGLFDRGGWGGNRGYGDGFGGGYGTDTSVGRSPGPSRSSSGGSTGARYESTGFGSTSRR